MLNQQPKQLNKTSKEFRKLFLLEFTKELIKNSGVREIVELENIIKINEEKERKKDVIIVDEERERIKKRMKLKEEKSYLFVAPPKIPGILKPKITQKEEQFSLAPIVKPDERFLSPPPPPMPRVLRTPMPRAYPKVEYIRPVPTKTQIDLVKINSLITDPVISQIECGGADKNIIVRSSMGTKQTNIVLSDSDINEIIDKFSEKSKIPVQEGIFKVAVGELIFTAVISKTISSRFIIKKMGYGPGAQPFRR